MQGMHTVGCVISLTKINICAINWASKCSIWKLMAKNVLFCAGEILLATRGGEWLAVRWEIRKLSIFRIRGTWLANSDEYASWQSTTIDNSRESRSGSTALLSFTSRVFQTFSENYWAILLIVLEIPANKLKCNFAKDQLYMYIYDSY